MATLIKETHVYEVDTEQEADELIKRSIQETQGDISFARKFKEKKSKGEVIGTWYEVKIEQLYPDKKMTNNL